MRKHTPKQFRASSFWVWLSSLFYLHGHLSHSEKRQCLRRWDCLLMAVWLRAGWTPPPLQKQATDINCLFNLMFNILKQWPWSRAVASGVKGGDDYRGPRLRCGGVGWGGVGGCKKDAQDSWRRATVRRHESLSFTRVFKPCQFKYSKRV